MTDQKLEKYTFVHAIKADCIVELAGARRAILPVFKMGLTKLQDQRSFRMEEEDFSLLKTNLANKKTPTPILYEHGKSARGGIAGGKLISLQEKDGEIFAHANLTKKAYEECKDEEWLSCSGGFLASKDADGNIRPVEMCEVSFTNFPAMTGLSDIQTFTVLEALPEPIKGTESQLEVTPPALEPVPALSPVVSTEPVKLDTQVTVNVPCPCPNCPCPGCSCCTADEADEPAQDVSATPMPMGMEAKVAEKVETEAKRGSAKVHFEDGAVHDLKDITDEVVELTQEQSENIIEMVATARFDEKVKSELIVTLMEQGRLDGKIIPANKEAMEILCTANPAAFKIALSTMKAILPIKRTVNDALVKVDLGLLDSSPEREATILTKVMQLKKAHPDLSLQELTGLVKENF